MSYSTSKASSSSEKRVVKTLFGEESNSTSPKNLFDDDLFKKIDRDTIIQRLRECNYQKKPSSSKEYLFKLLLEYANERNLSIHDVLERSPILTPSGSVDGTTKRTYLTPTMNKSTQTAELSERKEIVSNWNMICYRISNPYSQRELKGKIEKIHAAHKKEIEEKDKQV